MTDLQLERRKQPDLSQVAPGLLMTPPLGDEYWTYRVVVSAVPGDGPWRDRPQAVVGFPKFFSIGIGFAHEVADWNTNLPSNCDTEEIFQHIRRNKGDDTIADDDVRAAIRLIQEAVAEDKRGRQA